MSDIAQRFSQNLKRQLAHSPLTQEELAAQAGMHRTQVPNLLKGKQIPRLDTAIKLAATLGVPLEALTEGIHWTPAVSAKGKFDISGPNR